MAIGDRGPAADGVVTVSGPGSKLTLTGFDSGLNVGDDGKGTLIVDNGGVVDPAFLTVGRHAGSVGNVLVSGANSRIILAGEGFGPTPGIFGAFMNVAFDGTGTMTVADGAQVLVDGTGMTAFPGFSVGRGPGSLGKLTVTGTGSLIEVKSDLTGHVPGDGTAVIQVGRAGDGILEILNGGQVRMNATGGLTTVGRKSGSAGAVVVGLGSTFDAGDLLLIGKDFDFGTFTPLADGGLGLVTVFEPADLFFGAVELGPLGALVRVQTGVVQESAAANTNSVLATIFSSSAQQTMVEEAGTARNEEQKKEEKKKKKEDQAAGKDRQKKEEEQAPKMCT